ncbi:hypothetical protein [Paenibacillus sp. GCM10012306]|uniref:hypothetical protein n=1 Tax=Paenibacillus sp. GCM10012306 TaxID=3317342 RepID=UPI00361346BC
MDNIILWGGLVLVITLLTYLNQKQRYSSSVRFAYRELRELVQDINAGQSSDADLSRWEGALAELEKHPGEFNKLEAELRLRGTFASYLERHYPQDNRLPALQEVAAYRKDSVWGIRIGDYSSKK